ncbi:MAG: patatin-like phospholipase family protein [Sulfuricellaceae bacterium]|nr:patatin-like phospholipase family protein [Sulfuricellaceae bacterium]
MKTLSTILAICLFSMLSIPAMSASDQASAKRPKIGLALSGGGARGAAHVGVLKIIEEMGIPIDYVAGTSMGSVIGGLYASGLSPAQIEELLRTTDWDMAFKDEPPRTEQSQRGRSDDRLYLSNKIAGVKDGKINVPSALIQGQQFDFLLKSMTLHVANIHDFDRLPIPFRAVATDAVTGEEVVLGSGDLARAMRASMAVPGAFAAVEIGDKLLVDGGMANNLPISVVRAMGADIVIAVDIGTPLLKREEIGSLLGMMNQLTGFLTVRNSQQQIATLTSNDLLIVPALGTIGSGDFGKVMEAIKTGELATQEKRNELTQKFVSAGELTHKLVLTGEQAAKVKQSDLVALNEQDGAHKKGKPFSPPMIEFVKFKNNSVISEAMLRSHFGDMEGQPLDLAKVQHGLNRIYSLDAFQNVRYNLVQENAQTGIEVEAVTKSWGTNSLQMGLALSSEKDLGSSFNIGVAYSVAPLNAYNGQWRTGIQFGQDPILSSEIYQPLDPAADYFVYGRLAAGNTSQRSYTDDHADAEYSISRLGGQFALGKNFGTLGDIRLGIKRYRGSTEMIVGTENPYPNYDFKEGQLYLRSQLETLDSPNFPRSGYYARLEFDTSQSALGSTTEYDQVKFRSTAAKSWGDHTLIGTLSLGTTTKGEAPIEGRLLLGGFLNLSGFQPNALSGQDMALGGVTYLYRLHQSSILPVYLGGGLQVGNTWEDSSEARLNNLIKSGTLLIGADTPLGPFYLGYGHAEGGRNSIYFYLGRPWY